MKLQLKFLGLAATLLIATPLSWLAHAQTQAPAPVKAKYTAPTVEELWRHPKLYGLTLSRNGRYLAGTTSFNGRMNLMVIDLETRQGATLTNFSDVDAINVQWMGDDKLLFSLGKYDAPSMVREFEGGGLYVVNRDGSGYRRLARSVQEAEAENATFRALSVHKVIPGNTQEIIAEGNQTVSDAIDLYRLNVTNGKLTQITLGRPAVQTHSWLLDSKLVPRVVTGTIKDTLTEVVYYRKDGSSPWNEIARFDATKGPTLVPLAFEADDKTLQVAYNDGRDTMAVFRYDPETRTVGERIAQHPRFDMGANAAGEQVSGVIVDPETDALIGYRVDADKPEAVWIDPKYARIQKLLDQSLPGRVNRFRPTPDGKKVFVTSYSDTVPTRWYFLDEAKLKLEELAAARPDLEGKLIEQKPFVFKSRDGLEFTGYYFLPPDYKPGSKIPTIVHVHGGPMARADYWGGGFGVLEGQLFASRGYAVIVPNFRITPGLGGKNYYAGFGSFGRQMIEDHEDAVNWAVQQGFADPARVCISGGSYGGYAALMGPAKNPGFYKCAISGMAPTDMKYQLTTMDGDTALSVSGQDYWKKVIGSDNLDAPIVRQISPLYLADRIKIPVFLYAGRDDVRVPLDQIDRMAKALTAAGNPPKAFVVKSKEGHGFSKVENRVDLYNQILDFLDKYLAH